MQLSQSSSCVVYKSFWSDYSQNIQPDEASKQKVVKTIKSKAKTHFLKINSKTRMKTKMILHVADHKITFSTV